MKRFRCSAACALALLGLAPGARAQTAPPFSATDTFGTGPVQIALASAQAQFTPAGLAITLTFGQPVAAPSAAAPNSVGGYVDFDTDQNVATGIPSSAALTNDPDPVPNLGVDFYADLFSEQNHPGTIDIFDTATGGVSAAVPITYGTDSLAFTAPLAAFGGAPGPYNYDVVIGTAGASPEPTDVAPDNATPLQTTVAAVPEAPPEALLALGLGTLFFLRGRKTHSAAWRVIGSLP